MLRYGADSLTETSNLGSIHLENSKSMHNKRAAMGFTDSLASFIKSGSCAGPLDEKDLPPGFRVNTLFAIEQETKFRDLVEYSMK